MAKSRKELSTEVAVSQKISSEDVKRRMIAEAAFYNSQKRGQLGGNMIEDWLLAEKQIEQQLHN